MPRTNFYWNKEDPFHIFLEKNKFFIYEFRNQGIKVNSYLPEEEEEFKPRIFPVAEDILRRSGGHCE